MQSTYGDIISANLQMKRIYFPFTRESELEDMVMNDKDKVDFGGKGKTRGVDPSVTS